MPRIAPLPEAEAADKVEQTYGRIKEMLGADVVPAVFLPYGRVPAFLQDFYMNYKRFVVADGKLSAKTKALIALAVSSVQRCEPWLDELSARCRALGWDEQALTDTIAVAATCAMYNAFFKFRDLAGSEVFGGMAAGLRAHTFANTTLDEQTVELINIAVSDLNACKPCTSGHVDAARKMGISDEAILEVIQCTATMSAGNIYLNAAGA